MAQGTYSPDVDLHVEDANGVIVSGGLVWTYLAGLSTPVATYTDINLSVANTNPIVADSSGRFVAFLTPGISYKFVYEAAATPPAHGAVIITRDNILGVPLSSGNVEITGTAGETLTAGQAVYLSDGSGSKVSGSWYKADSANAYSSTINVVGMVPATIASGSTGTIRLAGSVTGLTTVAGSAYYVGSAGAITTTGTSRRLLGTADTNTSLVLVSNPPLFPIIPVNPQITQGRLTLTTALPVTTSDVTAATTVYFSPYAGNQIALYDGSAVWNLRTLTEISIAVPATTSTLYDVYVYDNSGTPTLELTAWTNDTTRATALTTQNGVYVKTGVTTRKYLGSFRTTTVSGQTEDSTTKRYVWNYYNRIPRVLQRYETDATWNYTTATVRQAQGDPANQVDIITGVAEEPFDLSLMATVFTATAAVPVSVGIGEDSTTTYAVGATVQLNASPGTLTCRLVKIPSVGRHFYSWNEWSTASGGTTTWNGAVGSVGSTITNGLSGWIEG